MNLVQTPNGLFLVASSRELGVVITYAYDPASGALSHVDEAYFVSSAAPPDGVTIQEIGGVWHFALEGTDTLAGLSISMDAHGNLTRGASAGAESTALNMTAVGFAEVDGIGHVMIGSAVGSGALTSYTVDAAGHLTEVSSLVLMGGDGVAALATFEVNGTDFVIYGTLNGNSITCATIDETGALTASASFGAAQGLGINTIQDISMVEQDGTTYAIVASAGSSSLTVIAISETGEMMLTDHVIDSLNTRFMNADQVETIVIDGVVFVVAVGSDDGVTVFNLMPDGTLVHRVSIVDAAEFGLTNVSEIQLYSDGNTLTILAASDAETGLQSLTLDTGFDGVVLFADGTESQLIGTAESDHIVGSDFADDIWGGGGNDFIYDGAGSDTLSGATGSDVFVFAADGETDTIVDFEYSKDRLDLSAFDFLRNVDQLTFVSTATGGRLIYGDEVIELVTRNGMPLTWEQVSGAIDLDLSHYMPEIGNGVIMHPEGTYEGVLYGTSNSDVITGGSGDDILIGFGGGDTYNGQDGVDTVDYSALGSKVIVDLADSNHNAGAAYGDSLSNIENIVGTSYDDRVAGDPADNHIYGGLGNDTIYGQTGRDQIYGGDGNDKLHGGKHKDRVYGDDGDDRVYGYWGHDYLKGGDGNDLLRGHSGNDRLYGGNGDDRLEGGEGDDYLSGGRGSDEFVFDLGHDYIRDFNSGMDILILDNALWGGADLTSQQIIEIYGVWDGDLFMLVFDEKNSLAFEGITDPNDLVGAMEFI
nr:calcium-binding protein [Celeribacter sp. PS-C1]